MIFKEKFYCKMNLFSYNIAKESAEIAKKQLETEGIKFWRPDDFMAEMLKKDKLM